jgi:hypothetical protein
MPLLTSFRPFDEVKDTPLLIPGEIGVSVGSAVRDGGSSKPQTSGDEVYPVTVLAGRIVGPIGARHQAIRGRGDIDRSTRYGEKLGQLGLEELVGDEGDIVGQGSVEWRHAPPPGRRRLWQLVEDRARVDVAHDEDAERRHEQKSRQAQHTPASRAAGERETVSECQPEQPNNSGAGLERQESGQLNTSRARDEHPLHVIQRSVHRGSE